MLPNEELQFSWKGKKFAILPINQISQLASVFTVDLENGICNNVRLNSDIVVSLIQNMIQHTCSADFQTQKDIARRKSHSNRANEGESMLILTKNQYEQKVIDVLHQSITPYA